MLTKDQNKLTKQEAKATFERALTMIYLDLIEEPDESAALEQAWNELCILAE